MLSDALLLERANEFAAEFGIGDDQGDGSEEDNEEEPGRRVSHGWLARFKQRHGIKCVQLHGEAASADTAGVDLARTKLPAILEEYHPDNVLNMDETGLNWRQGVRLGCCVCAITKCAHACGAF